MADTAGRRLAFPKDKMRVLLLEGVHDIAREKFKSSGYEAEIVRDAMTEEQLLAVIDSVHLLGIRSKTKVTEKVLAAGSRLLGIGCYCIGTDQVDLPTAARHGVPVFNAPFSSTRSVAELTMAEIVMLARRAAHRSMQLHQGVWEKSATGSLEVRHKTLGIVGYGHIGPQVGLLAEAFGMRVLFYDTARVMPLGNAQPVDSLDLLLEQSDFVSLHVPDTERTRCMIGAEQIARMRPGSYLLNLSRGRVVALDALRDAIERGHLAGAGVDVFPTEPARSRAEFSCELAGLDNVILTPHVGGSTMEAQESIGIDVTRSLVDFSDAGVSAGAVNFPSVDLPPAPVSHRILNVHCNEPGVLRDINRIVANMGANVLAQALSTNSEIGYLVMDVDPTLSREVKREITALSANIRTRLLF